MNKFIKTVIHFGLIGAIPVLIYLFWDPFHVIYSYEDGKVGGGNRDYQSTTNFINNLKRSKIEYDSFIFGNSRSIFYQVPDWEKQLPPDCKCYHFDAYGESLWALNKKIEFIDNNNLKIDNALLILDYSILIQDKPKSGLLFTITPVLVNNANLLDFHKAFFLAFLSPEFIYEKIYLQIPFIKKTKVIEDQSISYNPITNEIRFDFIEDLIRKNQYYDSKRLSEFYKRDTIQKYSSISIKNNQKVMLSNIHNIFKKQNTKIKIVISPLYDQEKLNVKDLIYLKILFGEDNVFDFSGINKFTNNYENYYENSHYRPHVAREILEEIY